ncbi:hypothetical protein BCF59_0444 [Mycoplasmopsis mustelae]|uniref:Uncharacterized protein n=1 Tax=Mycoplasmopsis mustelae TaxID=171289 RepID=A0A4R7UDB0_9BACT|nr:hypothetical protein [Mycoplasmopsis mustelae]TDV24472.1 hypothetical protein BCF59_0444 [Mycoplasmopsis mustelae]
MNKTKLFSILFGIVPITTVLVTGLVYLIKTFKDSNIDESDIQLQKYKKIKSYLDKYQNDVNIHRIYNDYFTSKFYYTELVGSIMTDKIQVFTNSYQVKNDFLVKFNKNFYSNLQQKRSEENKDEKLEFDLNKITDKELLDFNIKKFEETYLNGQNIDEFFKTKNLVLSEYDVDFINPENFMILSPNDNDLSNEILFIKVVPIYIWLKENNSLAGLVLDKFSFMDVAHVEKGYQIAIQNNEIKDGKILERIYTFLDDKYKEKE